MNYMDMKRHGARVRFNPALGKVGSIVRDQLRVTEDAISQARASGSSSSKCSACEHDAAGPFGARMVAWAPMMVDQDESSSECGPSANAIPTVFVVPQKAGQGLEVTQKRPSAHLTGSFSLDTIFNGFYTEDGELRISSNSAGGGTMSASLLGPNGSAARGAVVELTFSQPLETATAHDAEVAISFIAAERILTEISDPTGLIALPAPTVNSFSLRLPAAAGDRRLYVVLHKRLGDATVPVQAFVQASAVAGNTSGIAVAVSGLVASASVTMTTALCVPGTAAWRRLVNTVDYLSSYA